MSWNWLVSLIFPTSDQGVTTIISYPLIVIVGLVITTAVTEEILLKAYPIERMTRLTHQYWLAILISFVIFVMPHISFFGLSWLYTHGIGTVLSYVLYSWRRNLPANILLHFLGNAPILIPALMTRL